MSKAKTIFGQAMEIDDGGRRARYLDEACGGDARLRAEVEDLLRALGMAGSFMKRPAGGLPLTLDRTISEQPGSVIGPYKLLQQIGEGGFGIVYMAEQTEPVRRQVALKIIKPGMDTREVIARFESERQALALMDHPNIARVLDAGATESGRPYFVMELVKGVPITEYCDRNNVSTSERLQLFMTTCRAVQHAHQKGIIHRDIKPSNVMVTLHDGQPVPKVIDFGVAKATSHRLTERTLFTQYGQMIGTPVYMSPEQAEFSGLDIDTRSDVYSLGVMLYELLTGGTPFSEERLRELGFAEIQRIIAEEEPQRPSVRLSTMGEQLTIVARHRSVNASELGQLVRGDLDWIVMCALEKDRNRRYESPSSFAADVERFLSDEPVEARPPSVPYRMRKFVRRHRGPVLAGSILLATLVLGIAGTSVGMARAVRAQRAAGHEARRAMQAERLADERLQQLAQKHEALDVARGDAVRAAESLRTSLRQSDSLRLAAHSTALASSNPGRALLLAVEGARRASQRSASHNSPLVSALAACRERHTWFAPDVSAPDGRTGHTRFVAARVAPDRRRAVAVGLRSDDPAAEDHFARDKTDSAYVYDLETGEVTATMKLPGLWFATLAISPDSNLLAASTDHSIVARYDDGQAVAYTDECIRLWDMRTGAELRVLDGHTDRIASLCFDARGERLVSASWDGTARIWDLATGKTLHVLPHDAPALASAEFNADGSRVVTVATRQTKRSSDVAETIAGSRRFPDRIEQLVRNPAVRTGAAIRWMEPDSARRPAAGVPKTPPSLPRGCGMPAPAS